MDEVAYVVISQNWISGAPPKVERVFLNRQAALDFLLYASKLNSSLAYTIHEASLCR